MTDRVLIADRLSPRAAEVFAAHGLEAVTETGLDEAGLIRRIPGFAGLAVRSSTRVTEAVLAAAPELRVIGRAGIGVDNIDVAAATRRGVVVMNTPFGNSITTAEHTIALMLSLARNIPAASASTHAGRWEKSRFSGVELYRKTLGLVGCGNIGAIVANRAIGLGMRVIVADPFLAEERATELGVEVVQYDDLLAQADVISFHVPLTDATRNMMDAAALARCRPGVRIINCARGGLVDEAALRAAITDGQVAGAAVDVFRDEPARENPLFGLEQVVATPHLGASTEEAQENVSVQVAEQMSDYLRTGAVANALNIPSVTAEEAKKLAPYMRLADQLGRLAGQVAATGFRSVHIEFRGQASTLNVRALTSVALAGLLSPQLDSVNMINAPVLADSRNIRVTTATRESPGDYATEIRLTVQTQRQRREVAGTLLGREPRIIGIMGIDIEAQLGPNMLFITNADQPGLIGALGTTLGDNGVNIATFHLGRSAPGEDALALVEVDQPVSPELTDELARLPHVRSVRVLRF